MFGTTYGFSLVRRNISGTGGGGGTGEQIRWQAETLAQTAAFTAGSVVIPLTKTPVDPDGIVVLSEQIPLNPATDFTYLTGPARVVINFSGNPATDTDDGVWNFYVVYPYLL